MKKFFSLLVVAVSLLAATPASAQVSFGVKGGLNVTDMKLSEDVFDASNQARLVYRSYYQGGIASHGAQRRWCGTL